MSGVPGGDELLDDHLGFADHDEIGMGIEIRLRGHVRPADDHDLAPTLRQRDQAQAIRTLDVHASRHDQIGPGEVGLGDVGDVPVDQPARPFGRQHGCDRQQAERDGGMARAPDFAGRLDVPERSHGELRRHQEHIALTSRHGLFTDA